MASIKSWVKAARLRTLPLALSGILVGSALAILFHAFSWTIFLLAVATAIGLQVFSNFANDYGDFLKGTDNEHRVGPVRTMQGGEISKKEMQAGMFVVGAFCLLCGFFLLYEAHISMSALLVFIALGLVCLLAAYFYTAGKHAYGYVGLGDVAVFVFFGLVAVYGLFYLYTHSLNPLALLPAISIACFSTGVLNLNNMRDRQNDANSGKNTLVVRMGEERSKVYHLALIVIGWLAALIFTQLNLQSNWQFLFVLSLPLFVRDLLQIARIKEELLLDPYLKRLSISTLTFSLLFLLGVCL